MGFLLGLLLIVAPAYVWRFSIFGLPANFLMVAVVAVWVVFAIWLIKTNQLNSFFRGIARENKIVLILVALFFAAGVSSLLVDGIDRAKLGQFIVLFVQPLSLFFIARHVFRGDERARAVVTYAVYIVVAAAGILAIAQYFTLATLPFQWWGNANEPKRAISFFIHPNGFALFVAPLLAWLLPEVASRLSAWRNRSDTVLIFAWTLGSIGLFLSLSRGAWFGLAAAGIVFVLLAGNKKYLITAGALAVIMAGVIIATPNLRYRLTLPFQGEKSAVARISLWQTGQKMIRDAPVLGKGLNGFSNNWDKYNTDPNLDHYNFPHNIFLNFWIDTGLLGLASFGLIIVFALVRGTRERSHRFKLGMVLFLVVIITHGLIDIPYLKNDLALAYWLLLGISL